MAFNPTFLVELDKELALLRSLRSKVDARIQALEVVREPIDFGQESLPFVTGSGAVTLQPVTLSAQGRVSNPKGPATFRSLVLDALKQVGPSKARVVADKLEALGYQNDSPTRLSTRVYNDLWRMTQTGMAKAENGVFALVEGATDK